jgi:Holliday junction DNA helicase RuvA
MIGSLRGSVLERGPTGDVLVEVGGVGYRVAVPTGTLAALEPGTAAFLFTHLHVRDDALDLYGFATRDERATFEALLGATGVGPKLALAILSAHSPSSLRRAVAEGDVDALTLVSGVGKRTAQRLVMELQSRLDLPISDTVPGTGQPTARAEVRAALAELGYAHDEVRDVLAALPDDAPVEALLRDALRQLAGSRA